MSERYLFSILVPTQIVGLLIGKNGAYFRDMSRLSTAKLFLQSYEDMPENCRERVLIVSGSKLAIIQALSKVFDRIRCRSQTTESSDQDSTQLIKWVIPQSLCGPLIGRGGEGIKKINELSGSWVKVAHLEEFTSGVDERLVYIRGTPAQNACALQIIINKVGGRPFDDIEKAVEPLESDDDKSVSVPFLSLQSILFTTPDREIFAVDNVIDIAGASLYIDSDFDMDATEAKLRISGSRQSRAMAKAMVAQRLEKWRNENDIPAPSTTSPLGGGNLAEVDESAEYCIKFLVAADAADWLASSADSAGENVIGGIQYRTGCYIQLLPCTTIISNLFPGARRVAMVAPSYPHLADALGMLLDFIHVVNPLSMPKIPVQLAIKKKQIPDQEHRIGQIPTHGQGGQVLTPRQQQVQMVQAHLQQQAAIAAAATAAGTPPAGLAGGGPGGGGYSPRSALSIQLGSRGSPVGSPIGSPMSTPTKSVGSTSGQINSMAPAFVPRSFSNSGIHHSISGDRNGPSSPLGSPIPLAWLGEDRHMAASPVHEMVPGVLSPQGRLQESLGGGGGGGGSRSPVGSPVGSPVAGARGSTGFSSTRGRMPSNGSSNGFHGSAVGSPLLHRSGGGFHSSGRSGSPDSDYSGLGSPVGNGNGLQGFPQFQGFLDPPQQHQHQRRSPHVEGRKKKHNVPSISGWESLSNSPSMDSPPGGGGNGFHAAAGAMGSGMALVGHPGGLRVRTSSSSSSSSSGSPHSSFIAGAGGAMFALGGDALTGEKNGLMPAQKSAPSPRALPEAFSMLSLSPNGASSGASRKPMGTPPSLSPRSGNTTPRSGAPSLEDFPWNNSFGATGGGGGSSLVASLGGTPIAGAMPIMPPLPRKPDDFAYAFGHNFDFDSSTPRKDESEFRSDDEDEEGDPIPGSSSDNDFFDASLNGSLEGQSAWIGQSLEGMNKW